jgi:methanogenic corrinoid protein MtbC1
MSISPSNDIALAIERNRDRVAETVTDLQYSHYPELAERFGPAGRRKCLEDAHYHLSYLSQAIAADQPALFADYIAWAKVMLAGRNIQVKDLEANLLFLRRALDDVLPPEQAVEVHTYIDAALLLLPDAPTEVPTLIDGERPIDLLARQYLASLLRRERHIAAQLILDAVENGTGIRDIYMDVFQRCQYEVGQLWQMNKISVAHEHYCTAATQLVMSQLYPRIFSSERNGHTMVATCIAGDLHEIGLRMVADFFEMDGWDTTYLGANVPARDLLAMLESQPTDLLAISATMTFHIGRVAELIAAVRSRDTLRDVRLIVGGYPFNVAPGLWPEIGADGHATDADSALAIAHNLLR